MRIINILILSVLLVGCASTGKPLLDLDDTVDAYGTSSYQGGSLLDYLGGTLVANIISDILVEDPLKKKEPEAIKDDQ